MTSKPGSRWSRVARWRMATTAIKQSTVLRTVSPLARQWR
jgi:hypothetical protein